MIRPKNEQLTLLAQQGFSDPIRVMPLPANGNVVDRFPHAACYAALLPEPADVRQALAVEERGTMRFQPERMPF